MQNKAKQIHSRPDTPTSTRANMDKASSNEDNVDMKNLYLGASTTESMFHSFTTRLDKLASKVETLTAENAMKDNQGEAMKRFGIIMDKIQGIEERLRLVETALVVRHPDGHVQPFSQVGNTITSML